jgi:hypothetical protein
MAELSQDQIWWEQWKKDNTTVVPPQSQEEIKAHHAQLEAILPPGWEVWKTKLWNGLYVSKNGPYDIDKVHIVVDKDNWFYNEPMRWPLAAEKLNFWAIRSIDTNPRSIVGPREYVIGVAFNPGALVQQDLARLHEVIMSPRPADW